MDLLLDMPAVRPCGQPARALGVAPLLVLLGCYDTSLLGELRSAEHMVPSDEAFRIVLLPDTQGYAYGENTYIFHQQTAWIADHARDLEIAFVIHLGDITDWNSNREWNTASQAMSNLDGVVPYSTLPGNHDGLQQGLVETERYNWYFPFERFFEHGQEGGRMGTSNDNNYWLFSASGHDFLVLSLAYGTPDEALFWANDVIATHPAHKVILATHAYMSRDGTRLVRGERFAVKDPHWNDGDQIWNKLVRHHPNIFMVVSGHVSGGGVLVSTGDHGNPVFQLLADYQDEPNGGDGWLRVLTLDPAQHKIGVQAYSPTRNELLLDVDHTFTLDYDFAP